MSSGQRPRTPDEFPRMKHRAAGRRMRNLRRAYTRAGGATGIIEAVRAVVKVIEEQFVKPILAAIRDAGRQSDYALVPAPPAAPLGASRHDVAEEWHDPTHGAIDREIQEAVSRSFPNVPLATRVAIERTAQDRKNRGLTW